MSKMGITRTQSIVAIAIVTLIAASIAAYYLVILPSAVPAKPESITISMWGGVWVDALKETSIKEFESETGIEVKILLQASASETVAMIRAAWPKSPVDVLFGGDVAVSDAVKENFTVPMTEEEMPNLKELPKAMVDPKGHWVAIDTYYAVIVYRPDILKNLGIPEPKYGEWSWLERPELKGKISFVDYTRYTSEQFIVALALANGGDEKRSEAGWDMLKRLLKTGNVGALWGSESENLRQLGTGEFPVTVTFSLQAGILAKEYPTGVCYTDPPLGAADRAAIIKGTGREYWAKKFLNTFLSAENNGKWCGAGGLTPVNPGGMEYWKEYAPEMVPLLPTPEQMLKTYVPDCDYMASQREAWLTKWRDEIVPLVPG